MGITPAERRMPRSGLADLGEVIFYPLWVGPVLGLPWSVLVALGSATWDEYVSLFTLMYLALAALALFTFPPVCRKRRRQFLWVSDEEVGRTSREPRQRLGKIVVASEMNSAWEKIFVYDDRGRLVFGAPAYPCPRWKWVRFLRAEGLPVEVQPWRVPLWFRPWRFLQIISGKG